ncbi:MAG: flagellar basal body rod protein FlgC [bacterium]
MGIVGRSRRPEAAGRLFTAIDASGSGMTAERLRMDIIANNIANVNSTRTPEGGPYRREQAIFTPRPAGWHFPIPFGNILNLVDQLKANQTDPKHIPFEDEIGSGPYPRRGVRVLAIVKDQSPFRMEYQPGHPDADKRGYVQMPNVNIVHEMTDMISASRAYEANVSAVQSAKNMMMRALQIGRA